MEMPSYKYETDAKCSQWYFLEQRKVGGLNSPSGVLFISYETKVFLLQAGKSCERRLCFTHGSRGWGM